MKSGKSERIDTEPASMRGGSRAVVAAVAVVVFAAAVVVGVVMWRNSTREVPTDAPGTVYSEVTAEPHTVNCVRGGSSLQLHRVVAGKVTWYQQLDDHLAPGQTYRGQLRIVKRNDPSLRTYSGLDLAEFVSDDGRTSILRPFPPTCE